MFVRQGDASPQLPQESRWRVDCGGPVGRPLTWLRQRRPRPMVSPRWSAQTRPLLMSRWSCEAAAASAALHLAAPCCCSGWSSSGPDPAGGRLPPPSWSLVCPSGGTHVLAETRGHQTDALVTSHRLKVKYCIRIRIRTSVKALLLEVCVCVCVPAVHEKRCV